MCTDILDNPAENVFLAASRDHSFLLSHRGTVLHTPIESSKSNCNHDKNPTSSTTHTWSSSSNPNGPQHPAYYARKRDAQVEYLSIINTALRHTVQIANFAEPNQTRKEQEALICDVNKEGRYISCKNMVQVNPFTTSGMSSFQH